MAVGASAVFAVVAAGLLLWLRYEIVGAYTTDPAVIDIAAGLLLFVALYQFVDDTQVTAVGALRGYKDVRAPMLTALIAYWAIALPLGAVLGFGALGTPWGVEGFWVGLVVGLAVASVVLLARLGWLSRNERRIRMFALG